MVSIHRPLGYGPSTLPLRHSANSLSENSSFLSTCWNFNERDKIQQTADAIMLNGAREKPRSVLLEWPGANVLIIVLSPSPVCVYYAWGISSNGRALALHARGTGIDTRILHYNISPNVKYVDRTI